MANNKKHFGGKMAKKILLCDYGEQWEEMAFEREIRILGDDGISGKLVYPFYLLTDY